MKRDLLMSCILAGSLLGLASGQSDRGTITGMVRDPQGGTVSGAAIELTNTATGTTFRTQATASGDYTIPSLPVGTYDLTVQQPGFQKYSQTGIQTVVAQILRVDVTLTIGSVSESVTVHADASLLKTESAEQSTLIKPEVIDHLPLLSAGAGAIRNTLSFVVLGAGVFGENANNLKINGAPPQSFRIVLEGQDSGSNLNTGQYQDEMASIDSIQEIQLQQSNFQAEFGQAGSVVNMTARSGTNQYHGSVFDIMANEAFDAGKPFTDDGKRHHARPRDRKHDWGFNAGGPLRIPKLYNGTNRTFFFLNFEKSRLNNRAYNIMSVPSNAERNGNFSYDLTGRTLTTDQIGRAVMEGTIYDPLTDRVIGGNVIRDPFPGNAIPLSRMDPIALKIQNLMPKPTLNVSNDAPVNNWAYTTPTYGDSMFVPSLKIDHTYKNARISGYWQWTQQDNIQPPDWPAPLYSGQEMQINMHTVRVNYDQTISPTLLNHFGVGDQHFHNLAFTPFQDFNAQRDLGMNGALGGGFPRIAGAFGSTAIGSSAPYILRLSEKPTAVESLTWVHGKHTYKFGGEFKIDSFSTLRYDSSLGVYNFSAQQTTLPSAQGLNLGGGALGDSYASFLLGLVSSATISNPITPMFRRRTWAFFAQDTWRISRRLTLDYGLRWDYQPLWREIHNRISEFDPSIPNPSAGGLLGATKYAGYGAGTCNCTYGSRTYPYAFGPRLGLAYQIDQKTVLRAGWGISYGQTQGASSLGSTVGYEWNTFSYSTPAYGMAAVSLQNGLNYDLAQLYRPTLNPGIRPSPGQLDSPPNRWDDNGGRPPRLQNWSIGVQREINKNLMVEGAYVGERGVWWQVDSLVNYNGISLQRLKAFGLDPANAQDRTLLTSRLDSPLAQARGLGAPYPGYPLSATVAQSLRPFPQFGTVGSTWAPLGNNWYDSLQAKVTQRFSRGLSMGLAYTWSKTLGDVDGPKNDPYNRGLAKSITSYDRPQYLVLNVLYEVPSFGLARNGVLRETLRGWEIGYIGRYGSGTPIASPTSQNSLSALTFWNTTMNRVAGVPLYTKDLNCRCIDPNKDFALNPAAWTDAPAGQMGTAAPYYSDYRTRRLATETMSLAKAFTIRERVSFNIRFELFNVLNRIQLPSPTSSNPLATQRVSSIGVPQSGFGYINAAGTSGQRVGQLVMRVRF